MQKRTFDEESRFGERWAPAVADSKTMGNTFMFETEDMGYEVPFKRPDFAYDITKLSFFADFEKPENFRGYSLGGSHWTYEYGGQLDIVRDCEDVDLELRKLTYGIWDYIKNSGRFPRAKNYALKRICAKSGSRESRRINGLYMLTENDVEAKRDYPETYIPERYVKSLRFPVKAGTDGFVPLRIDAETGKDGKVYIVLCENPAVSYGYGSTRPVGAVTERLHTEERCEGLIRHDAPPLSPETGYIFMEHHQMKQRNLLFCDCVPTQHHYRADKILAGYGRPFGTPRLWQAWGADGEAQTLRLQAPAPQDIHGICVVVDTELDKDEKPYTVPPAVIRDLVVTVTDKTGNSRTVCVTDNVLRAVELPVEVKDAVGVAVTVNATHGGIGGIYGVRLR